MKTIVYIFFSFVIALTCLACDFNDTPVENEHGELYGALKKDFEKWDTYSEEEKISKLSESYYLGYYPADLSLLGFITGKSVYFDYVNDIISIYKRKFVVKGMFRPTSLLGGATWYRDQFARDNKLLYEAYVYKNNPDILNLIEQQVSYWLEKVPRAEHNGYVLFPYGIAEDGSIMSYEINPNQNLQVASLFSHLYWEPKSLYYKDKLFKEIVYNEVNAVVALQKENGSLPLREGLPLVEDSNYGGYSGDMLYHLAQMWGEQSWIKSTIKIGEWLYRDFSKEHPWNVADDWPNFSSERTHNSFNLIGRILPFYAAGISKSEILNWISYIKETFPDDELDMATRWYLYQSIPRNYLSEKPVTNYLSPYIFNDDIFNERISIRVVGEKIDAIELHIKDKNGSIIYQDRFYGVDSFRKNISMTEGLYSYKVLVRGNKEKYSNIEGRFTVKVKGDICFDFYVFDLNNTFLDKVM